MTRIPSDEDFERADRLAEDRARNLDIVCANVKQLFADQCSFHNIYILPQRDVDFRTYVFFKTDADLVDCETSGVTSQIRDAVYEELKRAGRGNKEEITVAFEFDSDENVNRQFSGNYFSRLR